MKSSQEKARKIIRNLTNIEVHFGTFRNLFKMTYLYRYITNELLFISEEIPIFLVALSKKTDYGSSFSKTGELTDFYKHFYKLVISHCHLA